MERWGEERSVECLLKVNIYAVLLLPVLAAPIQK